MMTEKISRGIKFSHLTTDWQFTENHGNVDKIPNPITTQFGLFHLHWSRSRDLSKRLIGADGGPKNPSGGP